MSVLDRILRHAPGIVAKGFQGKRLGEDRQRAIENEEADRRIRQQDRDAAIRRQAMQDSIMQDREGREAELHPVRLEQARETARHQKALSGAAGALTYSRLREPLSPEDRSYGTTRGALEAKEDMGVPLVTPRAPPRPSGALTNEQRQERAVAGQIDDTRSDLARAEREGAPKMQRPMFLPKAREGGFLADSTAAAGKIAGLKQRSDSLTAEHDRIVGGMQGRTARPPRSLPPGDDADDDQSAYQQEMAEVLRLADEARADGEPNADVDAALATAVRRIYRKYGIKP